MTREKTKISGKLVATVLSIVTCIAVMGVGVWATATEFSMEITNSIDLVFSANNIDVYAYAKNVGNGYYADGCGIGAIEANSDLFYDRDAGESTDIIATDGHFPAKLYSAKDFVINESAQMTNYDMFADWQSRSGFSDKTMQKTTQSANVEYIFTIKPTLGSDIADYAFSINETSLPTPTIGTDIFSSQYEYRVSVDGETFGEWQTIEYGTDETPGVQKQGAVDGKAGLFVMNFGQSGAEVSPQQIVQIRATCFYSNPNRTTVIVDDEWRFQITFYTAETYEEVLMGSLSTRTDTTLEVLNLYMDYGSGFEYNRNLYFG